MLVRIVKEEPLKHLRSHNSLVSSQHGFIPDKFYTCYMLTAVDRMLKAYDDGPASSLRPLTGFLTFHFSMGFKAMELSILRWKFHMDSLPAES